MNFDTLLIDPAMAAPALASAQPINLEGLGNYPLLQLLGCLILLALSVMAYMRGLQNRPPPPSAEAAAGTKMFFDGPVIQALGKLSAIKDGIDRLETSQAAMTLQVTRVAVQQESHAREIERNSERTKELTRAVEENSETTADLSRRIDRVQRR